MKKIVLFFILLINTCYASQLINYQDTVNALNNGKRITYVINWDLCKINIPDVKPNLSSSYSPENINISSGSKGFLQSQGMIYTHEVGMIPKLGPVNQAYVYTFTDDNELHVINRFLDPVTFAEKRAPIEATCKLGGGFKVFD